MLVCFTADGHNSCLHHITCCAHDFASLVSSELTCTQGDELLCDHWWGVYDHYAQYDEFYKSWWDKFDLDTTNHYINSDVGDSTIALDLAINSYVTPDCTDLSIVQDMTDCYVTPDGVDLTIALDAINGYVIPDGVNFAIALKVIGYCYVNPDGVNFTIHLDIMKCYCPISINSSVTCHRAIWQNEIRSWSHITGLLDKRVICHICPE